MSITNCRGDELKAQIVAKYDLACTAHLTLLDGQDKDGCCGRLTDEYYFFEYTAIEGDETGGFFVGRHCALKFAELADIDLPAKFNPLEAMGTAVVVETEARRESNGIHSTANYTPPSMSS